MRLKIIIRQISENPKTVLTSLRFKFIFIPSITVSLMAISLLSLCPKVIYGAEVVYEITPAIIEISARAGEEKTTTVLFTNSSAEKSDFSLSLKSLWLDEDGHYVLTDSDQESIVNWITAPVVKFTLNANEEKSLDFKFNVPLKTSAGSYMGGIFFLGEPLVPDNQSVNDQAEGLRVNVLQQMGSVVLINIGPELSKEGKIGSLSLTKISFSQENLKIKIATENDGGIYFTNKSKVIVSNIFGKTVRDINFPSGVVLPGNRRNFLLDISTTGLMGYYRIRSEMYIDGKVIDSIEKGLLIMPSKSNLLLITALLVLILLMRRKIINSLHHFSKKINWKLASDLSKRQKKILNYVIAHGSVTNRKVQETLQISNKTAYLELCEMVSKNYLVESGGGRNISYKLREYKSNHSE